MRQLLALLIILSVYCDCFSQQSSAGSRLKYIVYDFDGLQVGSADLPDGDYGTGDLKYSVSGNPLPASDVIADRCLKLDLNWQSGQGEFGKATMRFLHLDKNADRFNFYFYNPSSNSSPAQVRLLMLDDDNDNNNFEDAADDKWIRDLSLSSGSGWQLVSVPLSEFSDGNAGGDGSMNANYGSPGGMLLSVGLIFSRSSPASVSDTYYIDMICFSEGALPTGSDPLQLPYSGEGRCALGALSSVPPDEVPGMIESYLPQGKKLAFVNWFVYYSNTGTIANSLPGSEVQALIDAGYQPVITWEAMFAEYARLDERQPDLDQINNGSFDSYIDAFAGKIRSYSGTVIMRIFHEFEGDWYPWSLSRNANDPAKYISAFRHVVDRFRSAGASNVKWMWCLNAEPKPYSAYNWVVSAYPGDSYVDIVATDIYNHPDYGTPAWKSFRYTMAESYYYLSRYYSHKPIYVCEVGSRERSAGEGSDIQSKAGWTCMMSKDLKSYFSLTKALIFFSMQKEHDWRINSSEAARQAFIDCIWKDPYFGGPVVAAENKEQGRELCAFPNPFIDKLNLYLPSVPDPQSLSEIKITDNAGRMIYSHSSAHLPSYIDIGKTLPPGMYTIYIKAGNESCRKKLLRAIE